MSQRTSYNMMSPTDREALAVRLAKAAIELSDLRAVLASAAVKPYEGAGTTLVRVESAAMVTLDLDTEVVQRALWSLAERLDRDLASKV